MSEAKPARLPQLRPEHLRSLLFAVAAVCALTAMALLWVGWQDMNNAPPGEALSVTRDRIASQLASRMNGLREQMRTALADPDLQALLATDSRDAAAERLRSNWPALVHAQFFSPRLELAIGEEGNGGFGRVAVVGQALVDAEVAVAVVGKAGNLRLGMALAGDASGGAAPPVAYIELPMAGFFALIEQAEVGGGLLELRNGNELLASRGDAGLHGLALPNPVRGTPFTLADAAPQSATGADPLVSLGAGVAALLAGFVAFGFARRMRVVAPIGADEPTLADTVAAAPAPAPVVKAAPPPAPAPKARQVAVDRSIFRAYDIRGVVGTTLDEGVARLIGQAVGSEMRQRGLREIVVGRDGRLSGPALAAALIDGLRAAGCDVIDVGCVPTPVVYFASHHLHAGSCVAVTGSHNPPDYNGFKIVIGGETLSGDAIHALYDRIADDALQSDGQGGLQSMDVGRDYIDRIASDVQLERRLRVVVDCGNGVAGGIAPDVLEAIGCEVETLYCEVDGHFPNHHPDPSEPDNLADLITAVQRTRADLGVAFDGDGDRLGVVTASGRIIYPDRVLMLFARDVLSRNPGAPVIYDVKCTGHLAGQILRHGGSPIMWKTGHSLIKAKMRETDAELAGEMSGHFFFKERWYGFDDGIYAAARLLEILAADEQDPEQVFAGLPDSVSTPELKLPMKEGEHYQFIEAFREKARFDGAKIVTIDGVRADWADGWGLVRCSNTTPSLVLRFDADSEAALARIQNEFRVQIEHTQPGMKLPF